MPRGPHLIPSSKEPGVFIKSLGCANNVTQARTTARRGIKRNKSESKAGKKGEQKSVKEREVNDWCVSLRPAGSTASEQRRLDKHQEHYITAPFLYPGWWVSRSKSPFFTYSTLFATGP